MCCSVHGHKIENVFSDSIQIFNRDNSVGYGDYKEYPHNRFSENFDFKLLNFRKKTQISITIS